MIQKENEEIKVTHSRNRKGVSSKQTGEANDYILKRYKLEENRLFKQKHNEELRYEVQQQQDIIEMEEDIEDELVIVPMQHSRCEQSPNASQSEPSNSYKNQQIFVFDEDEDEDQHTNYPQINQDMAMSSPNSSFNCQSNINPTYNHSQVLSAKPTLRDNCSAAQLATPQPRQFQKKGTQHPSHVVSKISKEQDEEEENEVQQEQPYGVQHIKGVKVGKESFNNGVSITITDKKIFGLSKLPSGIILKCIVKRTASFLNLMSPEFDLYLANGLKHIISAKKYPLRNRQLFKFSINPLKFDEANQIAVMHANVNHNIYWVLDQPRKIGQMDLSLIYLVVGYYKLKSEEKQRRFTTLIPPTSNAEYQLAMDYELSSINFGNMKEQITTEISNMQKWKNQNCNSTKNFVLADEDDPDYRYLEMKKESDDVFELTIQHPFSPLQAMAIAMTRFDAQLK